MDAPVVGIDVVRDRLDTHVHPSEANFAVDRTAEGVEQLCERLRPLKPKLVVLEATGGLEAMVARALTTWRLPAVIVNPAQVRAFAHASGQRAKTDRIDATVIARFAAATNPPVRARADAETQGFADLVTRRRQIVGLIASERQRASQAPSCIRDSVRCVKEVLGQEQSVIDRSIDAEPARQERALDLCDGHHFRIFVVFGACRDCGPALRTGHGLVRERLTLLHPRALHMPVQVRAQSSKHHRRAGLQRRPWWRPPMSREGVGLGLGGAASRPANAPSNSCRRNKPACVQRRRRSARRGRLASWHLTRQ